MKNVAYVRTPFVREVCKHKVFHLIGPRGIHWNFLGPETLSEEVFRQLCHQLFPAAAQTAFAENPDGVVKTKDVLTCLAELLVLQGFKPCEIVSANHYFPPPDILRQMCEHNDRVFRCQTLER